MQEINREVNTIGSKVDSLSIKHMIVDMKNNVEKIREQAQNMIETGVARGGMLPKLQACLEALKKNVEIHIVDGRKPHAILNCMSDNPPGTFIK